MKKLITLITLLIPFTLFAQNNVRIVPNRANVCENTTISVQTSGNSFFPLSYVWSTGDTTPSITITTSGTYTCIVTGYGPRSFMTRTYNLSQTYTILPKPTIDIVNGPWVCRFDTVTLSTTSGYNNYVWNNGTTNTIYTSVRDSIYGVSSLDTSIVWYTASIPNVCSVNSDTIVIRGVRAPNGAGQFYCGRTNINLNDSIPAGLVLEYMYPNQYEMEFTQVSDPTNVITYFPPLSSRKAPANLLIPGEEYSLRTRVIINGQTFCWGTPCIVGVSAPLKAQPMVKYDTQPSLLDKVPVVAVKNYRIYSISGKLVSIHSSDSFNPSWLLNEPTGMYLIQTIYKNEIITTKYNKQ